MTRSECRGETKKKEKQKKMQRESIPKIEYKNET